MRVAFNAKYLVVKWADIDAYLTDQQCQVFEALLQQIREGRANHGKSENTYLVVNTDEPYAKEVAALLYQHGHCAAKGDTDVLVSIDLEEGVTNDQPRD